MEVAQQANTQALELTEGDTSSWADILKDGKFEHLPTTTPIPSKETAHLATSTNLTTPQLTKTTNSENCNVGIDKTHRKQGQKRKPSAPISKDTKGHGSLQLDRGRQEQGSHIC